MAHAKMFGRYALTGLAVVAGFTATSLITFRCVGICSGALWSLFH